MLNQIITSSMPQSTARDAASRSTTATSAAKTASNAIPTENSVDSPNATRFDAVLALQLQDHNSTASSTADGLMPQLKPSKNTGEFANLTAAAPTGKSQDSTATTDVALTLATLIQANPQPAVTPPTAKSDKEKIHSNQIDALPPTAPDTATLAQATGIILPATVQPIAVAQSDATPNSPNERASNNAPVTAHPSAKTPASPTAALQTAPVSATPITGQTPATEPAALQALPKLMTASLPSTVDNNVTTPTSLPQAVANFQTDLLNAGNPAQQITAPLGSQAWPEEFSQKVTWVSSQQNQSAELHLNPPDLGPMSVTLTITDNQATAQFSSPHLSVREAIENALPKLRESLADNGIMLGNTSVNDQAPRDGGANNFTPSRTPTPEQRPVLNAAVAIPREVTRRHQGMVDTFA